MNVLTNTAKITHKIVGGFIYHYDSNSTDVVMVSLLPTHQYRKSSDLFCRKLRDVVAVQYAVEGQCYYRYGNINVGTHHDSGECFNLGEDDTMSECLDRGRGMNLFDNDAMKELFGDCENREIFVDHAMNEAAGIEEMGSYSEASKASASQSSECANDNIDVAQACINEDNKNKLFRCSYCSHMFCSRANLEKHQFESCGEDEFRRKGGGRNCPECGKVCCSKGALNVHMRDIHNNKKYWYPCSLCEESFAYLNDFKIHTAIHRKKKPYHCSKCDKRFMSMRYLKVHFDAQHTNQQNKIECSYCIVKFSCLKSLKKHLSYAHNITHRCSLCIRTFISSNALEEHCYEKHNNNVW